MEFVDKPTDTSASRGISAIVEILVIVRVYASQIISFLWPCTGWAKLSDTTLPFCL